MRIVTRPTPNEQTHDMDGSEKQCKLEVKLPSPEFGYYGFAEVAEVTEVCGSFSKTSKMESKDSNSLRN